MSHFKKDTKKLTKIQEKEIEKYASIALQKYKIDKPDA